MILSDDGKAVDLAATEALRSEMRECAQEQRNAGIGKNQQRLQPRRNDGWRQLAISRRPGDLLTMGSKKLSVAAAAAIVYCDAKENYKLYALHRVMHLSEVMPPLPTGEPYIGEYHIYACPGCATQLQVDMFSPSLGGDAVLWDTRIDADKLKTR